MCMKFRSDLLSPKIANSHSRLNEIESNMRFKTKHNNYNVSLHLLYACKCLYQLFTTNFTNCPKDMYIMYMYVCNKEKPGKQIKCNVHKIIEKVLRNAFLSIKIVFVGSIGCSQHQVLHIKLRNRRLNRFDSG